MVHRSCIDDAVWLPTVFTKNRERLIAHDAVIELFNHVLEVADKQDWLSGEHFSVDATFIHACAGHNSFLRKDSIDDRQVMVHELERVDQMFVLMMTAYNLTRMRILGLIRLHPQ